MGTRLESEYLEDGRLILMLDDVTLHGLRMRKARLDHLVDEAEDVFLSVLLHAELVLRQNALHVLKHQIKRRLLILVVALHELNVGA